MIMNELELLPILLVAVQVIVWTPAEKVSPERTGLTPSKQAIDGVGVPSAVTVKVTAAPAPGLLSVTVLLAGTWITGADPTVTVTVSDAVSWPSSPVRRSTYTPATEKSACVVGEVASVNVTVPG